ncbi:hypothetical protein [Archaeoglobus neptunius]|uniref:hypothetical protein n=1 Tax=Archaeoglobus neptunius TaxID=2798580 RepID=UPI00192806F6|nr:hypothetical protein [Archaeoglobus neptunius]
MKAKHLLILVGLSLAFGLIALVVMHGSENVKVSSNLCDPKKDVVLNFVDDALSKDLGILTLMIDDEYYKWLKNNTGWIEVEYKSGDVKKVLIFKSGKMGVIAVLREGWYCYGLNGSDVDVLFEQACG